RVAQLERREPTGFQDGRLSGLLGVLDPLLGARRRLGGFLCRIRVALGLRATAEAVADRVRVAPRGLSDFDAGDRPSFCGEDRSPIPEARHIRGSDATSLPGEGGAVARAAGAIDLELIPGGADRLPCVGAAAVGAGEG